MNKFEVVTIVVTLAALAVAIVMSLRPGGTFADVSRGGFWFDHSEDLALEVRPSEDERDEPIPRRALRGRSA
jgi:hypothetical protein